MSLVNLNDAINRLDRDNVAIGAFNVSCWEMAPAIVAAAERLNVPVVLQSQWPFLDHAGVARAAKFLVDVAERSKVPVALQLDHARSWEQIMLCLRSGFSSIMIDASHLPFEENIQLVTEVVNAAHGMGVSVESELGRLSGREDEVVVDEADALLTDSAEAAEFCERTGVDALAVSIGTVHGDYRGQLNIDFSRLETLNDQSEIPLVLHGASGVPAAMLRRTINCGIKKINFSTELRAAWLSSLRQTVNSASPEPIHCLKMAEQAVRDVVESKINILMNR